MNGYLIYYNGNLISFKTRKQRRMALSSFEVEPIALTAGVTKAAYLREVLKIIDEPIKKRLQLGAKILVPLKRFERQNLHGRASTSM